MTRYTTAVSADPSIPDLDLQTEAAHVAECLAALEFAREQYALIRSSLNRIGAGIVLLRTQRVVTQLAQDELSERRKAERLLERYRTEALGAFMRQQLRVGPERHLKKMDEVIAHVTQKAEERARQAQRIAEAAAYAARSNHHAKTPSVSSKATVPSNAPQQLARVSDASLIAEVKGGRHDSISSVARAVGLAVPSVATRVKKLVASGVLTEADVPRYDPKKHLKAARHAN